MGLRGPAPQPTKIKQIRGNPGHLAKAALDPEAEVQPIAGKPKPRRSASKEARAEFNALCRTLGDMGILSKSDGVCISMMAENLALYDRILGEMASFRGKGISDIYGLDNGGRLVARPFIKMLCELEGRIHNMAREFGLTPSARSRIKAIQKEKGITSSVWDELAGEEEAASIQ